jgi:predicted nucleic acid-binding protein
VTDRVFVDTSALYAVFDADDASHEVASSTWGRLCASIAAGDVEAITHNGVVLETTALLQSRIGVRAVRDLYDEVLPAMVVRWLGAVEHRQAVVATVAADRRRVSLVDWMSFLLMRDEGVTRAFAFDDDFEQQGFETYR